MNRHIEPESLGYLVEARGRHLTGKAAGPAAGERTAPTRLVRERVGAHGGMRLRLEALVTGFGVGAVYLATLAGNHSEAEDGLAYAVRVRNGAGADLFDPNHLVYNWLGWVAYHLARGLGYDGGPVGPMQVANAGLGALGIALLWLLLRNAIASPLMAVAGCGLVAFSYGYWFYSVEVEVYALSTVLLILSLTAAYHAALRPSWRAFALLGLANGLAVLGHTTNLLFAAVALVALLIAWRTMPLQRVVHCGLAYAGAAVITVVPPYALAIAVSGLSTPREVYDWYTGLVQNGNWGVWSTANVPKALIGSGRALIGGHFALALGTIREAVEAGLPAWNPREEVFLVRDFSQALAVLLCMLAVVVALALLLAAAGWLRRPALDTRARALAWLCLGWLAAYVPFFVWWEPMNIEFWLAQWVPLAVLLVLPLAAAERTVWPRVRPLGVVAALIGALFVVNLLGSVRPQQRESNDYWRERVAWYARDARSSDLVVGSGFIWANYVRYFTGADVLDTGAVFFEHGDDRAGALAAIRRRVEDSSAKRVLFSREAFYPAADAVTCCRARGAADEDVALIREEFLSRSQLVAETPLEAIWQLARP